MKKLKYIVTILTIWFAAISAVGQTQTLGISQSQSGNPTNGCNVCYTISIQYSISNVKNIERLEWFIEKATEIGITEITPIICRYSERKVVKEERLVHFQCFLTLFSILFWPCLAPIWRITGFTTCTPIFALFLFKFSAVSSEPWGLAELNYALNDMF